MTNDERRTRPFGLPSATALVVANMIGAGVFTTSGFSYGDLGSRGLVLLAWCVGGIIALCGAISYGRLVERIQISGGEYVFLSRALHPALGFVAGWVSLLAGFTGAIAFAAQAFETYALPVSARPDGYVFGTLAIASIVVFAALHAVVVHHGLRVQNVVVLAKLLLLVVFLGWGIATWPGGRWEGPRAAIDTGTFQLASFAGALVWISLSYSGFNAAVYVAGEVRDARRNVPRSLWLGALIVTIFYVALNAVFLYAPDPAAIRFREDVAIPAAQTIGGDVLVLVVRVVICLALLSSVSSMVVAGPRVYAQMARDGVFPRVFAGLSEGSHGEGLRPGAAVLLQAVLAIVVVCATDLENLLGYLGFTLSLSAAATVACLFVLPKKPREERTFVDHPVIPILYVGATLSLALLAAWHRPRQFAAMLVTLVSGVIVYALMRKRPKRV